MCWMELFKRYFFQVTAVLLFKPFTEITSSNVSLLFNFKAIGEYVRICASGDLSAAINPI